MTGTTELLIAIEDGPPWADGHFPGDPLLPGAKLLDHVIDAMTRAHALPESGCQIAQSKFSAPVRPGDTVRLSWTVTGTRLHFTCMVDTSIVASGQISGLTNTTPLNNS